MSDDGPSAGPVTSIRRSAADAAAIHPTHRHLQAILSNPLLAPPPPEATVKPGGNPMEVFDRAVAKGLMTLKAATGCLLSLRRQQQAEMKRSGSSTLRLGPEPGAARRVLQWLRSSGSEREMEYLEDQRFTNLLVSFMVAEGFEPLAWEWLEKLLTGDGMSTGAQLRSRRFKHLLLHLVAAKSQGAPSLNEAYATLFRAEDTFRNQAEFNYKLYQPWMLLSKQSTAVRQKPEAPSGALFDMFVDKGRELNEPVGFELANLDLHHPRRPNHVKAVEYFHDESTWRRGLQSPNDTSRRVAPERQLNMGLEAAKRLNVLGEHSEALWLLQLLQSNFESLLKPVQMPAPG